MNKHATPPPVDPWSRPTQYRWYPWPEILWPFGIAGLMVLVAILFPDLGN